MRQTTLIIILINIFILSLKNNCIAQYPYGDTWYTNPLGFKPIQLHTSMGFLIPTVAVSSILLLTKQNLNLKNKLSIFNETSVCFGYKYPYTTISQNNSGFNFMLRKYMSVGAEFDIYLPLDNFNKTIGFALRPFARFYPINLAKWRLYFESGGGFVYFVNQFPKVTPQDNRLGTYWNGTTKYGLGAEISFNRNTDLLVGVRHLHVSNGNNKGVERNPSHDSNGFFIGLSRKIL